MHRDLDLSIHFEEVPEHISWTLPLWTSHDFEEIDDLIYSVGTYVSSSDEVHLNELAQVCAVDKVNRVRFFVGSDLPEEIPIKFQPTTEHLAENAPEIVDDQDTHPAALALRDAAGFMSLAGEWERLKSELTAIKECIQAAEDPPAIEIGFDLRLQPDASSTAAKHFELDPLL